MSSRAVSSAWTTSARSTGPHLPAGYILEQSDATGWMGAYALAMGSIAAVLNWTGARKTQDLVMKFLEHFASIRQALDQQGLWDAADGLFYDRLTDPFGHAVPVKVRSMVAIIPALAAAVIDGDMLENALASTSCSRISWSARGSATSRS